ncbi:MBL fold metallo-hydrolase [Chryseobacterium sp. UNC8MFCol]|uniref:MBL fold metallo-hydrolase n=1 Tax=Chryseobacterium sp. UNC8MFCol TaxID=1340435 RepID=UPI000482CA84|nr:MBL fold metallo-hydrolase [Chryseobacterium sp. UNC8MFCol]
MKTKISLIIGLCLSFSIATSAQSTSLFLQKSMKALGNWETIDNFEYTTIRMNLDKWQGYDFSNPMPEKDSFFLSFDRKENRFLHHTQNHYPGGYLFDTYRLGRDSTYYVYDGIGSRTGRELINLGSSSFNNRKNALLNAFPYFILKQLLSDSKDESLLAEEKDFIISRKTSAGTEEYLFDKNTFLLKKISKTQGQDTLIQRFDDYSSTDGLMIARKSSLERNGTLVYSDSLTSFRYNKGIDKKVFDFPAGYKSVTEQSPKLSAKNLAKDIYLIENVDGDRNVLFVNMGTYIVLTEAPVSSSTAQSILEIIHTTLPGIPVKYVHLSHFHNDHIAGIAQLVREGASIICTESMKQPVTAMLSNTDNNLYKNGKVDFMVFNGKKRLQNGRKTLEFFEIPNSHAKGMSFLYIPDEKLIYQGDLLSLPADSYLTPAIAVTKEFSAFLRQKKIIFTQIIGHHGLAVISENTFDKVIHMK